ncbi:MAG: formate--tetrahydrofolate ligase [Chloroflexi bacterium]|nr:formate--tetrahydrofolate ligase [Chloroflexota bacterium]
MRPLADVAAAMGLPAHVLEPYGWSMAKVPLEAFPSSAGQGKLVVVTAMTPTPLGEGKTTTVIGLVDALARAGKRPVATLRQPSMGPVFGSKGGGTGGGRASLLPEADINLHFTGDAHAVAAAHNLLAALANAAVHQELVPGLDAGGLRWRYVANVEDRALRQVVIGLGGRQNAPLRETGFDIDAASEIMAVLGLSTGYEDLRARLGRLVVGFARDGTPVTAKDVNAVGPMMALLRHAIKPNLVQTAEGQPALVHTGPFGNIAQGCSSVLADLLASRCSDLVVTEAGFGADLGFEKFMHLKTRMGGVPPNAAVVVVTVRAVKWHGGAALKEVAKADMETLTRGLCTVEHAVSVVQKFGVPAVVAVNRFPEDRPEELGALKAAALRAGADAAVESCVFSRGGEGGIELAEAVIAASQRPASLRYLYPIEASIEEKVAALATQVYNAGEVEWEPEARVQAERYSRHGWGALPVCVAKTHLSISADPKKRGCPQGHTFPIRELRIAAGAGFVYALAGDIVTMPGLPRRPNAFQIDVDEKGNVVGLV